MTDRAVVELSEHICTRCGYRHPVGMEGGSCLAAARVEIEPSPPPRALVALSDDRQWLVVLLPNVHQYHGQFAVLRCVFTGDYKIEETFVDTGQDAHQVLAAFLAGRTA